MDDLATLIPLTELLDIEVIGASQEEVSGRMAWASERCTSAGILHGGAIMAFADTLGAVCAALNLTEGATTATIESKTNFFRAVRDGHVDGVARPLHAGRRVIVVQTDVHDAGGRHVAQITQTQAVIRPQEG